MGIVGDDLDKEIDKELRKTTLGILRDVVVPTPVKTGRARGNWQITERDTTKDIDRLDKTGQTVISTESAKVKAGADLYYITNNLPYIERLNDGYSDQAPKKFIETAIKRNTK